MPDPTMLADTTLANELTLIVPLGLLLLTLLWVGWLLYRRDRSS
jgi:hypothetical protein